MYAKCLKRIVGKVKKEQIGVYDEVQRSVPQGNRITWQNEGEYATLRKRLKCILQNG